MTSLRDEQCQDTQQRGTRQSEAQVLYERAEDHYRLKRFTQAANDLAGVIALDASHAPAYAMLGEMQMKNGDLRTAKRNLQYALRLQPNFAGAHSCLGELYILQEDYQSAARSLEEAIRLDPNLHAAHLCLGIVRMENYQINEAIACFSRAIKLNPRGCGAYVGRAQCYGKLRQPKKSGADFVRAKELDDGDDLT